MSRSHTSSQPCQQRGFTMMELMVAMTIGLVIAGLIGGMYTGSKKSSRYQEATARMQENARFATDNMSRAIRNAGWNGCGTISKTANVVTGGTTNWWFNLATPVIGYEGGVSTFPTGIPTAGYGTLVANTDAFSAVGIDNANELSVINHVANSAQINTTANTLDPGVILVMTDCSHTAIFQMTGPAGGHSSNAVHNTGNSTSPGNCYKGLGTSCSGTETNYTFQPGASLTQLTASLFYIGTSATGSGRSLWAMKLGATGAMSAVELIEGIDNMQIDYGEDLDNDGAPDRYVIASAVSSWGKVVTMRVSLLSSTIDDRVASAAQTYTYNNASVTASDLRVRRPYTSVFTLRNRSQ